MKFCTRCGASLSGRTNRCGRCGAPIYSGSKPRKNQIRLLGRVFAALLFAAALYAGSRYITETLLEGPRFSASPRFSETPRFKVRSEEAKVIIVSQNPQPTRIDRVILNERPGEELCDFKGSRVSHSGLPGAEYIGAECGDLPFDTEPWRRCMEAADARLRAEPGPVLKEFEARLSANPGPVLKEGEQLSLGVSCGDALVKLQIFTDRGDVSYTFGD